MEGDVLGRPSALATDLAEDRRNLGLRWLKLAEKARAARRPLTQASKPSVAVPARA